jgi:exopolysaccharide biosynthesis WecB/TagA/CpsF family protein
MQTDSPATVPVQQILQKLAIYDNAEALLSDLQQQFQAQADFKTVGFLNQHGFNLMLKDRSTFDAFLNLDYLLRDGIGISLALKYFSMPQGANLNGTDLIPQMVNRFNTDCTDCFVLGTQSPWLEQGSHKLIGENIKATKDGFHSLDSYISFLRHHIEPGRFSLIVLAMGMPKQEILAERIKQELQGRGLIICGGAIIDFQAGRFKRAPAWVQKCSLEWLYRLLKEPKRLFRRYVIGIPIFLFRIVFRV